MRDDKGLFHFKLCYPEITKVKSPCNEWKQSSNPYTKPKVTGFVPVDLTWPLNSDKKPFEGLMRSTLDKNLIDDAEGDKWGNSVGTLKDSEGKIPGPVDKSGNLILVDKKVLFVYTGHHAGI